jgi:ABC-2 type transport system permease protein
VIPTLARLEEPAAKYCRTKMELLVALAADVDLPPAALGTVGAIFLCFVLGYAFYGCLYAVAGSLVSRQEDLQYAQTPIMIFIFVGYGAAFYAVGEPTSPVAQILSFAPPFTPMMMLVRMVLGEATSLEVALAVLLMVAAMAGLVALAVRLYAGSVLRFGARVGLAEAWRSPGSRKSP